MKKPGAAIVVAGRCPVEYVTMASLAADNNNHSPKKLEKALYNAQRINKKYDEWEMGLEKIALQFSNVRERRRPREKEKAELKQ